MSNDLPGLLVKIITGVGNNISGKSFRLRYPYVGSATTQYAQYDTELILSRSPE